MTAFEVVQTILGFGMFAIALVGLCYKIFKDNNKTATVFNGSARGSC